VHRRMRCAKEHTPASVSLGMQSQIAAFVEQPGKMTFLAARDAVLAHSPLPLVAAELAELDRLLDLGEHQALLDWLDALPPSKILSPRIHFLAAEAADALGHADDVELERSLFVLTLQGLLATGDGTPVNPYIVCHPTDEYDILAALGVEPAGQSLVKKDGRFCDVLLCTNGREVWFDATRSLSIARPKKGVKRPSRRTRRHLRPSGKLS
jgi:hypothetical protein